VLRRRGPTASLLDGRAHGAQLPPAPLRDRHALEAVRRRRPGHRRPDRRHAQDDAGLPRAREVRGPLRRLPQPPQLARRARPDQGQPHRRGRLPGEGGRPRPRRRRRTWQDRGRGEDAGEVRQAVRAGAEVILLDNMTPGAQVRAAVARRRRAPRGGRGLRRRAPRDAGRLRAPGVDVISVGALTHSAPAADLSLTVLPRGAEPHDGLTAQTAW
jgi:hypothetical protein